MLPKRKTADAADADTGSGEGAWKWTPENDRTLFLMTMGRVALGKSDYEDIATALSPKVNWNAVRQRVGKFRQEQKKKFEELGWAVPEGTPAKVKAAAATPKKRKGSEEEDTGEKTPSKAKKPRAKKAAKSEENVQNDDEEGVKKEEVNEDA